MQTSAPSPRHLNGRLIFFASICIIWLLQVLSLSMENFSQRVRHGKRKNAQKKFEHPPNPMVYYSMDNLRGRLGSTRHERGLGCNTDSSTNFSSLETVGRHPNRKPCHAKVYGGLPDEENNLAAVIEGDLGFANSSDLSRSSIFWRRGRPDCKVESFKDRGVNEVAPPRLQSLYEKTATNPTVTK